MDFGLGDLLGSAASSGMDSAFSSVGSGYGGALGADFGGVGVGSMTGLTGSDLAGTGISAGGTLAGASADAGIASGAGASAGSLGGMSGLDFMNTFGGSGTSGWGNFANSIGPAAQKAFGQGGRGNSMYQGQIWNKEFPLDGRMYMRKHETPDAYKSKAVQADDPRQTWIRWWTDMNNFAYKGK